MNTPKYDLDEQQPLRICGFVGTTGPDELLRLLVPIFASQDEAIYVADGGNEHLTLAGFRELCSNGEATSIYPPIARLSRFLLAVGADPSLVSTSGLNRRYQVRASSGTASSSLWLFYAPEEELTLISDEISTKATRTALQYVEMAEFDLAARASNLGTRRVRRYLEAEALLWFTQSIQRTDEEQQSKYEILLSGEIGRNSRQVSGNPAVHLVANLFMKRGFSTLLRGAAGQSIRVVNDGDGRPYSDVTFVTEGVIAVHGFAGRVKVEPKQAQNPVVWTSLLRLWESISERLRTTDRSDRDSASVLARNFWRLMLEFGQVSGFSLNFDWLDSIRRTCWLEGVRSRASNHRRTASNLFQAAAHIASIFLRVHPDEPINFFHRAQCYETLGGEFRDRMKADLVLGLGLGGRSQFLGDKSYIYLLRTGQANAHRLLARIHATQGEWEDSIREYELAVRGLRDWLDNQRGQLFVHERYAQCLLDLGCLTGNAQMIEESLKTVDSLIASVEAHPQHLRPEPRFDQGWLQRGDCYLVLGRLSEAETSYQEFVRRRPNAYTGYDRLRLLHLHSHEDDKFDQDIADLASLARRRNDVLGLERAISLARSSFRFETILGADAGKMPRSETLYNLYLEASRESEISSKYRKLLVAESQDPLYSEFEPSFPELEAGEAA